MLLARPAEVQIPSSVKERIVYHLLHVTHVGAEGASQPSKRVTQHKLASERGSRPNMGGNARSFQVVYHCAWGLMQSCFIIQCITSMKGNSILQNSDRPSTRLVPSFHAGLPCKKPLRLPVSAQDSDFSTDHSSLLVPLSRRRKRQCGC